MSGYLHSAFIGVAFLFIGTGINAQDNHSDHIFLLNGEEVEAEVASFEGKYIQYRSYEEEGGPVLRVAKTEVDRVKMANGTELWFNRLPKEEKPEVEAAAPEPGKERKKRRPVSAQKLQRQR